MLFLYLIILWVGIRNGLDKMKEARAGNLGVTESNNMLQFLLNNDK